MAAYDYAEARENFDAMFDTALKEDVLINKDDFLKFKLVVLHSAKQKSPFDIDGIKTGITTAEILDTLQECRES